MRREVAKRSKALPVQSPRQALLCSAPPIGIDLGMLTNRRCATLADAGLMHAFSMRAHRCAHLVHASFSLLL